MLSNRSKATTDKAKAVALYYHEKNKKKKEKSGSEFNMLSDKPTKRQIVGRPTAPTTFLLRINCSRKKIKKIQNKCGSELDVLWRHIKS